MKQALRVLCAGALCFCGSVPAAQVSVLNNTVEVFSPLQEIPLVTQLDLADATTSSTINWDAATNVTTMMGATGMDGVWNYTWTVMADPDPFIDAVFSVTNMGSSTQAFTINFALPVSPPFYNGTMWGDLTAGFQDSSGDGNVTFAVDAWDGLVNGTSAMTLSTVSFAPVVCSGPNCSGSFSTSDGPLPYLGSTVNDIGLALSFTLSAGDTATFDTRFEVQPVPVPAAVWLFGSGLLGLVGVARARKAA